MRADKLGQVEADTLEEQPGFRVGVLVRMQNVGPVPVEDLCQGRDNTAPVGTGDEQGGDGLRFAHGSPWYQRRGWWSGRT